MELLPQPETANRLDIKKELRKYLQKWPWILASLIISLILAWLYLRYTPNQYTSRASVFVSKAQKKGGGALSDFQNINLQGSFGETDIQDEISMMKARPLMYRVVKNLNLDLKFISEGNVTERELYDQSPLLGKVLGITDLKKFSGRTYTIQPVDAFSYRLSTAGKKDRTFRYGATVHEDFGSFTISKVAGRKFDSALTLQIVNPTDAADRLEQQITISVPDKNSGILELSRTGVVAEKSEAVLDELIRQYNLDAIENKNQEAENTAKFIDDRLDLITRELGTIEGQKEAFKRSNQITDLETQAKLSVENANEATKKIMDVGTQLEMVNSVLAFANSANNEQLLPSNMGMPAGLDQLISDYNQLVLTRNRTLRQATPANPAVQQFNRDIAATRNLVRDNLVKTRATLRNTLSDLQARVNESREGISKFPGQERQFRNIDRQQNIKESLYLYLLQKREETSISLAVTTPKAKIVNPAYTPSAPVSPNRMTIWGGAALLGILLPVIILYIIFALDTKVKTKKDLSDALPDLPVLAEVPTVGKDESDLMGKNDLSVYAEAFRILTANLKFMLTKISGNAPVILFTSSVKGEGKTTVSVNSALSLSSTKKVIIIGADLRNPQLERYIVPRARGLSDYLADATVHTEDIIQPSGLTPNLDTISSGTIPPNPTDLLEDSRLADLLTDLRRRYDYVLIDSAPLMMVSDSFHILRHSDVLVYVARARYTEKELLDYAGTVAKDDNVSRMALVLNDVDKKEMRYGYGGKYGYGYHDEVKKPWWKF